MRETASALGDTANVKLALARRADFSTFPPYAPPPAPFEPIAAPHDMILGETALNLPDNADRRISSKDVTDRLVAIFGPCVDHVQPLLWVI